jgi:signal transduction histidine kinase
MLHPNTMIVITNAHRIIYADRNLERKPFHYLLNTVVPNLSQKNCPNHSVNFYFEQKLFSVKITLLGKKQIFLFDTHVENSFVDDFMTLPYMFLHEWRRPLAKMSALLQLEKNSLDQNLYHLLITSIHKLSFFASEMISSYGSLQENSCNLLDTLKKAEKYYKSLHERHAEIYSEIPSTIQLPITDKLMQIVFINIFENGHDAIMERNPTHGKIVLTARHNDNTLYIDITDNGAPLPKQLSTTDLFKFGVSTKKSGFGLGIIKLIIGHFLQGTVDFIDSREVTTKLLRIKIPLYQPDKDFKLDSVDSTKIK